MEKYQSVLPAASRRGCQAERTRERHLARQLKTCLAELFANGYWFCLDCQHTCERIEGEQGQSAHCNRCGSPRLEWNPPLAVAIGQEAA